MTKAQKLIIFIAFLFGVFVGYQLAQPQGDQELISPIPRASSLKIEQAYASESSPSGDIAPEVTKVEEIKFAKVTAYSCGGLETEEEIKMNCPSLLSGTPKTANGTEPIPYKTVACDRANMGRTFEIKGVGVVRCTDTGGAIKGAGRFDLYVSDVQEAREWGVQTLEYKEVL